MSFRTTKRQNLNQFAGSVTKKQCFIWMLTDGNVWDDVLFPEQVMHMSKSCGDSSKLVRINRLQDCGTTIFANHKVLS